MSLIGMHFVQLDAGRCDECGRAEYLNGTFHRFVDAWEESLKHPGSAVVKLTEQGIKVVAKPATIR